MNTDDHEYRLSYKCCDVKGLSDKQTQNSWLETIKTGEQLIKFITQVASWSYTGNVIVLVYTVDLIWVKTLIPSIHLNYWSKINKVIDLKPHWNI